MPRRRMDSPLVVFGMDFENGGMAVPARGVDWYVDTYSGKANASGKSWDSALSTMAAALVKAQTHDRIFFVGKVTEECVGSNLKFDVTIVGCGSQHHADQPGTAPNLYDYGSSVWQAPSSPTATTPLLEIRGRGWKIYNIFFDCPVDSSAIKLMTGTGSGTTEYDANHATIKGCDFRSGLYGIEDSGGCFNITVKDNVFETLDATSSAAAIRYTTTINAPRRWRIENNFFQADCDAISGTAGCERHIVSPLGGSLIKNNVFGTVKGTGKYIDLTGGAGNVVTGNVLGGLYDTTDYVAGTGDLWYRNSSVVKAGTSPDGNTLDVPGA